MQPLEKILKSNTGSAGILALVAMVFFGILGGAYVTLSSSSVKTSATFRDNIAAQYLAEAGAQWAINQLTATPSYGNTKVTAYSHKKNTNTPTAGTYEVTVKPNPDPAKSTEKIIISKGIVNQSERTVVLHVTAGLFTYAGYSNGDMFIDSAKIKGDAGSNGKITVSGHLPNTIEGSAECDKFDENSGSDSHNTVKGEVKPATGKILDLNEIMKHKPLFTTKGIALAKDDRDKSKVYDLTDSLYYYDGSYTITASDFPYQAVTNQPITLYVNGDFTIGQDITGDDITIYVNGNLKFTDGAAIKSKSNGAHNKLTIYATGNLECNSTVTQGEGLVVAGGDIKLNNGASGEQTIFIAGGNMEINPYSVVGALYANGTLSIHNKAVADYSKVRDFANQKLGGAPIIKSWDDREG